MPIIVDINIAHKVFKVGDPDFGVVNQGLFNTGKGIKVRLVYGGKLKREYERSHAILNVVIELDRAGKASVVPDRDVDREETLVSTMDVCVSDDPHIIALARVSGVRLLCSHDTDLHTDFTNKILLNNPRGKVYQCSKHAHLLRKYCRIP
jgi:hypothetical protein